MLVFGEWEDLAAQMQRREIDVLAVAGRSVSFLRRARSEGEGPLRGIRPSEIAALRLAMELTPRAFPRNLSVAAAGPPNGRPLQFRRGARLLPTISSIMSSAFSTTTRN
jgi:hypothetical protein